jgi:hypothetical protein
MHIFVVAALASAVRAKSPWYVPASSQLATAAKEGPCVSTFTAMGVEFDLSGDSGHLFSNDGEAFFDVAAS